MLVLPNADDIFVLDTDASGVAIGAELSQVQSGVERVIAYGSFALSKEQQRYCVTRRELLAVVRFTHQYRHYLVGKPFVIRTDHSSLRWLMHFKEPQGQMARWLEEMSHYPILHIEHREGRKHTNADALSRCTTSEQVSHWKLENYDIDPSELPCGDCKEYMKMLRDWASFIQIVDEAVPLSCQQQVNLHVNQDKQESKSCVFPISQCLVNGCNSPVSDISEMKQDVSAPPAKVEVCEKVQVEDTEVHRFVRSGWSAEQVSNNNLCVEKNGKLTPTQQHSCLANGCSISASDTCVVKPGASSPSEKVESYSKSCVIDESIVFNECRGCFNKTSGKTSAIPDSMPKTQCNDCFFTAPPANLGVCDDVISQWGELTSS